MEDGWMKSRREAKPLEELLKVAEIAKQTEEAVKAMKPETGTVSMLLDDREGTLCANRFRQQSSDSTLEPLGPLTHQEWHLSFYSVFIATKNTEEGGSTVRKERKRIQSGNHRGKTTLGNKTHSQIETQRKEGIFDWLPTFGRRGWEDQRNRDC